MRLLVIAFNFLFFCLSANLYGSSNMQQITTDTLPYFKIPEYPDDDNRGTAVARMVDGLGYRYYWATESLREVDLNYRPSEDSRTAREIINHIYDLTRGILACHKGEFMQRSDESLTMTFDEIREKTLMNIQQASQLLKSEGNEKMDDYKLRFKRGDNEVEYEYWHMLNGPLADAIYHVGQIVGHRRASGNPLNPFVSVFRGETRQ